MHLQWYAARTKPMAEHKATDQLKRTGIQVFCPCVQSRRLRLGLRDIPLFPGYLFIRCETEHGWSSSPAVPDVRGLVRFQGVAPPVPDEVIADISQRVEAMNQAGGLYPGLRAGDKVYVTLGSTESVAEVVAEPKPGQRLRVLMEFLGHLAHAEVPLEVVHPVGEQPIEPHNGGLLPRRTRGSGRWIRGYGPRAVEALPSAP